MVLAPAIFLASLAVQSRTYSDPFQPIGESKADQEAIIGYIPVMKATKPILAVNQAKADPAQLRSVADMWIRGGEKGELRPIYPVAIFDRTSEGTKGQIFLAASTLTDRLVLLVQRDLSAGDPELALQDDLRALRLVQVLKFSSFEAVHTCSRAQRRALQQLDFIVPRLNSEQKARLHQALAKLRDEQKPLTVLAALSKRLYTEDRVRKGEDPSLIVMTEQFSAMRRLMDNHSPASEWRRRGASSSLVSTESSGPDPMTMARVAYLSQAEFSSDLAEALQSASTGKD